MAEYRFGDGIKKFLLAGVGAVALSAEKGSELINELVKKGEITVEQGKDLNRDLQRSFKESMDKRGVNIDELSQKISKMSADELARIKEQVANAEKVLAEKLRKADEALNDFADAAEDKAADVGEAVEEAVEKATDAVDKTAEDAVDTAAAEAAEAVEDAVDAAEDVVEAVEEKAAEAEEVKPAEE